MISEFVSAWPLVIMQASEIRVVTWVYFQPEELQT